MTIQNWLSKLNRRDTCLFPRIITLSKIFLFIFISVSLISFSAKVFAAIDPITVSKVYNLVNENQIAVNEGGNQEAWLDHSMISNIISFARLLIGKLPETDPSTNQNGSFIPGGAIGTATNLVASTFTPAASGIEYIAQMKDNFLGKPAYAQGVGFNGLQPILPLWSSFRNVIYIFSSLIFIIIGIMIMLRTKISPQAVISVQNAIPQLITTLILVTFSYAIAGLLIDFMNFFQATVLIIIFGSANLKESLFQVSSQNQQNFQIYTWLTTGHSINLFSFEDLANHNGFFQTFGLVAQAIPGQVIMTLSILIGAVIGAFFSLPGAAIGAVVGPMIMLIVLIVIIFFNLIKLLFGLIKVYINIIIKIIFAPIEIGMGAFPNSKLGFSSWLTDMVANLAVFPSVLIFLVILNIISKNINGGIWTPPLLGAGGGLFTSAMLGALIGIGGLMLVAKLPDMIPQFIFNLKPSPWGNAIGESLNPNTIPSLINTAATTGSNINTGRKKMAALEIKDRNSDTPNPSKPISAEKTKTANDSLKAWYE